MTAGAKTMACEHAVFRAVQKRPTKQPSRIENQPGLNCTIPSVFYSQVAQNLCRHTLWESSSNSMSKIIFTPNDQYSVNAFTKKKYE